MAYYDDGISVLSKYVFIFPEFVNDFKNIDDKELAAISSDLRFDGSVDDSKIWMQAVSNVLKMEKIKVKTTISGKVSKKIDDIVSKVEKSSKKRGFRLF